MRARRRPSQLGMTLIEIMVVLAIIGLVMGFSGVQIMNSFEKAKKQTAETRIKMVGEALELYRLGLHNYPSTAEGLDALVHPKGGEESFLPQVPKDPWNNDFQYMFPGQHNPQGYDLCSPGKDGVIGTEDDVCNWERNK